MTRQTGSDEKEKEIQIKTHDDKIVRRVVLIVITTIVILFTIGIFSVYSYIAKSLEPVDPDSTEEIAINIPLGSSSTQIGEILEENKLIHDKRIFKFYLRFKNAANFQAGDYTLTQSLTLEELIEELQTGKIVEEALYVVTIPEGRNLEQIGEVFANKLDTFTSEEFVNKANDREFIEQLINKYPNTMTDAVLNTALYYPLEGYLFAGTYDIFEESPTAEEIIDKMVDRTNSIVQGLYSEILDSGLSVHEVLTLASVVERESKFSEDRPKVAQVYLNRIEHSMRLQSDITALYGLDHKQVMTYEDVKVDSPYNTYVIDGLPIGPINSPSQESISAVVMPEGEDFTGLYYFSRPNGETFYSKSLEEHNQIIDEYRHEWYELEDAKN